MTLARRGAAFKPVWRTKEKLCGVVVLIFILIFFLLLFPDGEIKIKITMKMPAKHLLRGRVFSIIVPAVSNV